MSIQAYTLRSEIVRVADRLEMKPVGFIPARLLELRIQHGLSQVELSRRALVAQGSVSKYESGESIPSADALARLAAILETSPEYLVGFTDDPVPFSDEERAMINAIRRGDLTAFQMYQKRAVKRLEDRLRQEGIPPVTGE